MGAKPSPDWASEIRKWCGKQRGIAPTLVDSIVAFFGQSFAHTLCPDHAWFGVHASGISLVVGGIYLSAINRGSTDRGLWLLLSNVPPPIKGLSHSPVKSSRDASQPLIWAHAASLDVIPDLIASRSLWALFEAASEQVLTASHSAADRDATQERRGKRRLSEFWLAASSQMFPDEVAPAMPLLEGAVRQIMVNAYERNPKARRQCIEAHGARCCACGLDFGLMYGPEFATFIHVHHLRPLSEIGSEYVINPVEDLRPVCPNCHAVIHYGGRLRNIEDVRRLLTLRGTGALRNNDGASAQNEGE